MLPFFWYWRFSLLSIHFKINLLALRIKFYFIRHFAICLIFLFRQNECMFMCLCVCVSSLFFSFLLFKFVLTPYHHTHSYDTSDLNLLSRMDIKERISSLNMSKQTYRQTHNVLHGCMHACACSFSCKIFILVFARPRQLKERALSFKSLVLVLALNPNFKVEIR